MKTQQFEEPRTQDSQPAGREPATSSPICLSGRGVRIASWAEHQMTLMRPARPMRSAGFPKSHWTTGSCRARARTDREPS
eukprot:13435917-Heterocapsa_arctica.AAC.1